MRNPLIKLTIINAIALAVILNACLSMNDVFGEETFIVKDGIPQAEIVIAEKPTRSVQLAAWELQTNIKKMSGATLPIVQQRGDSPVAIYVGASDGTKKLGVSAKDLKDGAYRMVSGDDWLVLIGDDADFTPIEPYALTRSQRGSEKIMKEWDAIAPSKWGLPMGNAFKMRMRDLPKRVGDESFDLPVLWAYDERGSYNAACAFLRKLGARWYMPGELGEVIPERTSITLPEIDETVHPDIPIRDNNIAVGIHDPNLALWGMRLGMRQGYGVGWAHGLNQVTCRKEMKEDHPEYYALLGGKRGTGYRSGGKQCLSSPGLIQQTIDHARTLFDHYNCSIVSVMPSDGYTSLCECPLCAGKGSPDQPQRGSMSDYVWGFVTEVANEVAKTHPDKKIGNVAYNYYLIPPTKVELPDNVVVGICGGRRPTEIDPKRRKEIRELREAWKGKTKNKLMNFENYPLTARGFWLPAFTPHTNAASVNAVKDEVFAENIQPSSHQFMDAAAFNSFKFYVTFRMYWGGKDKNVDEMLDEFYRLFYGPAEKPMKEFYEYCETNWPAMRDDKEKVDHALTLFDEARTMVEPDSIYAKRLAVLGEYLETLRARSEQIAKEEQRKYCPQLRMWRNPTVKVDGDLNDPYWRDIPGWSGGRLRETQTGRTPTFATSFKVAWGRNEIFFAIRCEEPNIESLNVKGDAKDDPAILEGDCVEILLETEQNSYYHIAVNPKGLVMDLNRDGGKETYRWDSQAEVATKIGDGFWTAEIRIPVIADSNDPFHQVIGRRPLSSLPWYLNVCRRRPRETGTEISAFSPTSSDQILVPERLAKFYYK